MVFGNGYAAADDVVGHELTHGYVEHTAGLFYLHQSGALNESLADTIGEVIDHRNRSRQRLGVEDRRGPAGRWYTPQHEGSAALRPARPDDQPTMWPPASGDDNGGVHRTPASATRRPT